MFLTNFAASVDAGGAPVGSLPASRSAGQFQSAFFGDSAPGGPVWSARKYYKQASYGLHLVSAGPGNVTDWLTAPKVRDYYGKEATGGDRLKGAEVRELVRWRVSQADVTFDFGPYDTDNDGFVDLACLVFQGAAQTDTGVVADLWPIRTVLDDTTDGSNPRRIYITGDTNALGVTVKVRDFIIVPELTPAAGGGFDTCTIGVFCHEYGHGIGWPDLYDTDNSAQ